MYLGDNSVDGAVNMNVFLEKERGVKGGLLDCLFGIGSAVNNTNSLTNTAHSHSS